MHPWTHCNHLYSCVDYSLRISRLFSRNRVGEKGNASNAFRSLITYIDGSPRVENFRVGPSRVVLCNQAASNLANGTETVIWTLRFSRSKSNRKKLIKLKIISYSCHYRLGKFVYAANITSSIRLTITQYLLECNWII